jgi:hypothetical protein
MMASKVRSLKCKAIQADVTRLDVTLKDVQGYGRLYVVSKGQ